MSFLCWILSGCKEKLYIMKAYCKDIQEKRQLELVKASNCLPNKSSGHCNDIWNLEGHSGELTDSSETSIFTWCFSALWFG